MIPLFSFIQICNALGLARHILAVELPCTLTVPTYAFIGEFQIRVYDATRLLGCTRCRFESSTNTVLPLPGVLRQDQIVSFVPRAGQAQLHLDKRGYLCSGAVVKHAPSTRFRVHSAARGGFYLQVYDASTDYNGHWLAVGTANWWSGPYVTVCSERAKATGWSLERRMLTCQHGGHSARVTCATDPGSRTSIKVLETPVDALLLDHVLLWRSNIACMETSVAEIDVSAPGILSV